MRAQLPDGLGAGGGQRVPLAQGRQRAVRERHILDIVQNEHPVGVCFQPAADNRHDAILLLGIPLW